MKIVFYIILSVQIIDLIMFYDFLMSFDIQNTPTRILRDLSSAHNIAHFYTIYDMSIKRGLNHLIHLSDIFFKKVLIFLNIFIYYDFFISQILFNLSAFEVRPSKRFLSSKSLRAIRLWIQRPKVVQLWVQRARIRKFH